MGVPVKVLIIDDHESIRESFEREFCPENGFKVVGSLASASLAEAACQAKAPDLIIMDVCTEGELSGIKAAQSIVRKYPAIKILVTSGFDEVTFIPRAKEAGAHAFVHKSSRLARFREVALRIMEGEYIFPEPKAIPVPAGETPFSEREMEVLQLLCRQVSNQEIADKLFISVNTVRRHIENMRHKTGFNTASELIIHVISNGWINPHT
ncbi:MAG: response regulator transcription factor [Treponema sp.]|nr:response regulator transcription factor [Treponema sp.]